MRGAILAPLVAALLVGCVTKKPQPMIVPEKLPAPQYSWKHLPPQASLKDEVAALYADYLMLDAAWKAREAQLEALRRATAK